MQLNNETVFLHNQLGRISQLLSSSDSKIGYFSLENGMREKKENQDGLLILQEGDKKRFAIADGAGGYPKGASASKTVLSKLRELQIDDSIRQIESANDEVRNLKYGCKTTLVMCDIDQDKVRFYTVGDSEVLYWNTRGKIIYNSIAHSPVGYKVASGVISQEQALEDEERNLVLGLIGDRNILISATNAYELKKGHTILIGSDGLFDNISHQEIIQVFREKNFEDGFEWLCQFCTVQEKELWKKFDDISFIVFQK